METMVFRMRRAFYLKYALDVKFERLGVVGAGVMGSGIALHWCSHGYDTVLVDLSQETLDRVSSTPRLTKSTKLDALSRCDLILEAVYEDVEVKSDVLSKLDRDYGGAILATNTSSLTLASLGRALTDRSRFLALHYNNPPDTNPVVEVVPHAETDAAIVDACDDFVTTTGKRPIRCKDEAGFALNRQSLPYINEAGRCLDEGLGSPASIDAVATQSLGFGLGPFTIVNLVGARVMATSIRNLAEHGPLYAPARCIQSKGETNAEWSFEDDGQVADVVEERLRGALYIPTLEIVNGGIASAEDLDFICTEALGYPIGSVAMMRALPSDELERIVTATCARVGMTPPDLSLPGA